LFTEYIQSYNQRQFVSANTSNQSSAATATDDRTSVVYTLVRVLAYPRRNTLAHDHEYEDVVAVWANMTGFLCALGGVCEHTRAKANASPSG
jgi:hypothetical protein